MKTKKEVQKSPQEVSEMNKSVSVDEYAEGDTSDEEVIYFFVIVYSTFKIWLKCCAHRILTLKKYML